MTINVNKLVDYYAGAAISFSDGFSEIVPSGSRERGSRTYHSAGGLLVPLKGSACFTLNGMPYILEPGMIMHAGPDMCLDKEVIGNKIWCYAVVHYQIPEQEHCSSPYYHEHFTFSTGLNTRIMDMTQQLLACEAARSSLAALRSRSLFHHLVEEILLAAKRQLCDNKSELIEDAVAYIYENYSQQLSIAKLAEQYGLGSKQFTRLFQMHTGIAPARFLAELRIQRAKDLLQTCSSVKQVAECVGFSDNLYFSKAFKKQTGVSPSEFRQHLKKV